MVSKGNAIAAQARNAAANRSKKGGKNLQLQYMLWMGGSMGAIVLAIAMMIVDPQKGPFETLVNDASLIAQINRNAKGWKAAASSMFEGWTLGDVKSLQGISVSGMGGALSPCPVPNVNVPENFDARTKWPECFTYPIYSMGNCTASWAIAAASALSNRYCIANPEVHETLMLSPQQLLSCDHANRGCSGGDIDSVFSYIQREGLVSEICFPYQADSSVSCGQKCTTEAPKKAAAPCVLNREQEIRREIFTSGPVVAPIFLLDDLLVYKGGLYQETSTATALADERRQRILHAVKIVGWGKEAGKPYWLLENSWGEDWGERGHIRVLRNTDPEKQGGKEGGIVLDSLVIAGTPANPKFAHFDDDSEGDFEAEAESDFGEMEAALAE
eukprot:TRINITY_DN23481_c0_g1_i1.p1 TRINITY_DN23481_c0_g1~~TRINITY_DN23481_c0_g1_i1.p1  ORF type:complete len:386 (+),score=76.99 TRINITY_DN23481_c0_g1_i1:36-1193(+)